MEISNVGIVGFGEMGMHIALAFNHSGFETTVWDQDTSALQLGMEHARALLKAQRGNENDSPEDREAVLIGLKETTRLTDLSVCELVFDTTPDNWEGKARLFQKLDGILEESSILGCATRTLPITKLGALSGRPDRTVGTHFSFLGSIRKIVEVVPGCMTSRDTLETTTWLLERAGQETITVKDSPGFILNYLLVPFLNDCIRLVEAGYSTPSEIDTALCLGLGYKMGLMRILDLEGLDNYREVALSLNEQLQDPRYFPPPLLDRMINAGYLGVKTGRGFYRYAKPSSSGDAEPLPSETSERDTSEGQRIADAVQKVGVIGLGTMGSGIAQICLTAGLEVVAVEASEEVLNTGLERIRKNLEGAVKRGKMSDAERERSLENLRGASSLNDLSDCDLIIEGVVEDIAVKRGIFQTLDTIAKKDAIFASNTSCLSITEMAAQTQRPDRVLGLHFFNPPYAMPLVEVIEALQTAPEILEFGIAFCRRIGKTPVPVKDRPGFLVNRLLVPYLNHAAQAWDDGLADRETLDKAIRLGAGHPMGPLTLLDLVGIDVQKSVGDAMAAELDGDRFTAPPLLSRMVAAGWLGRKTGRGFYEYGPK